MTPSRPRALTPSQQYLGLRSCALCPGQGGVRAGLLTWTYDVAPTALSRTYTVRLEQRPGEAPRVYVIKPDLVALAGGRRLPHVYEQQPTRLCLHYPDFREWHAGQLISHVIVPWVSLWLLYFEEWLVSDEWKGGGIHPPARTNKDKRWSRRKSAGKGGRR